GSLRIMPGVETNVAGHTFVWNVFLPAVALPVAFFLLMGAYPFVEQWATRDQRYHLVLDRPRNVPARTALGVAILAMAVDIQLAGADDAIAYHLHMPVEYLVWFLRIGFFGLPLISFAVTWHVCLALQRADRRKLQQGTVYGIAAAGRAYVPVSRPPSAEERAVLETRQPVELLMPTPRHLIPLPTPHRVGQQVRARLNHFYVRTRLETLSARAGMNGHQPDPDGKSKEPADGRASSSGRKRPPAAPGGDTY
ncbi:MAG: hypothetical protein WAK82_43285, partial [Streptosporangiaceae bacterium]